MKKRILFQLTFCLALAWASPLWASHGTLSSHDRDPWIDERVKDLVAAGWAEKPKGPVRDMTNLQVAQLTAQAAQMILAQADVLPPPSLDGLPPGLPGELAQPSLAAPADNSAPAASKSLRDLVEEFKSEISAMNVNLAKLEDKLYDQQLRAGQFADLQQEYLKRTGSEMTGFSHGIFNTYRGYGDGAAYGNMDYNDVMMIDFGIKSVPVPFLLFEAKTRLYRTVGLYYVDPITPPLVLRWLALKNYNEQFTFTAGDFYQKYTKLTLWNYEVPVYTFIEPTSFRRTRKDVEEIVYMDHGTDWHMRGFQASTALGWPDNEVLGRLKVQAMAGELKSSTEQSFSDYYAGTQASMSFFNDNLEFKGTGLLLWDDPNSASVPYLPYFSLSFAKQYQIGSISARFNLPIADQISLSGNTEAAFSQYNDDSRNADRTFQDWALLSEGSVNLFGVHLKAKYMNIGPFFYSPGAQTNRYNALPGAKGYISTNLYLDNNLPGYINNYVFQGVNRPAFAAYDRTVENILPYGDATPNRLGIILGISADIGKDGWLKPQASFVLDSGSLGMHEIQPNYVLDGLGDGAVAVETNTPPNVSTIRTFGGLEAAVGADIAKAAGLKDRTYSIGLDYKNQKTTLVGLGDPLITDTVILAADFSIPIPGISLVGSFAFVRTGSSGKEFILTGQGNPSSYANYPFYLDNSSIGSYSYESLNATKTTLAYGLEFPFTPEIRFKGDLFLTQYSTDNPDYERWDEIWRASYEVSF